MSRLNVRTSACIFIAMSFILPMQAHQPSDPASSTSANQNTSHWIGTWAAAPQQPVPDRLNIFENQSLRLIVHVSAGGTKVRVKISNIFGDAPLVIGSAHIARRLTEADIVPTSDRTLNFGGLPSTTISPGSTAVSDPVDLDVPALSDVAVSIFLPSNTTVKTLHILAKQTSYVSHPSRDATAAEKFPATLKIRSWPFLSGVDVAGSPHGISIVAFGSSLTDGDGSSSDANRRFPDILAERLQKSECWKTVGVLNEGIIGNRLLRDSPQQPGSPFGAALGQAGLTRFERDVLLQSGVKYVIVGLGINDIAFPGSLTPSSETVTPQSIITGYRQLITRAHQNGIRVIGTTLPPFENSFLVLGAPPKQPITFYTPEKERVRQKINDWILTSNEFDAVVDLDRVLRDPSHPTQLLPEYDSGDHLHPNDSGTRAEANAFDLSVFQGS